MACQWGHAYISLLLWKALLREFLKAPWQVGAARPMPVAFSPAGRRLLWDEEGRQCPGCSFTVAAGGALGVGRFLGKGKSNVGSATQLEMSAALTRF